MLACGTARDSATHTRGYAIELANLRSAFRWAADRGDLDTAGDIASYAASIGSRVEQYEPVGWAEELLDPAKAVGHRRLAQLYAMAALCNLAGRTEDALEYSEHAQAAIESGRFDPVPHESEAFLGGPYLSMGEPRGGSTGANKVIARDSGAAIYCPCVPRPGPHQRRRGEEAIAASTDSERCRDIRQSAHRLLGTPRIRGRLPRCRTAHRFCRPSPGLTIAQESGNRQILSNLAAGSCTIGGYRRGAQGRLRPIDPGDPQSVRFRQLLPVAQPAGGIGRVVRPTRTLSSRCHHRGVRRHAMARATQPQINTAITHLREVARRRGLPSPCPHRDGDDQRRNGRPTRSTRSTGSERSCNDYRRPAWSRSCSPTSRDRHDGGRRVPGQMRATLQSPRRSAAWTAE